eukprot:GHUV01028512.1.p1 GENE.GHUV01028512.1~~GHUV01028512.1.p1  ORF type:complete len:210 (+),score=27.61 GHUV01028512.1:443-1072(+)
MLWVSVVLLHAVALARRPLSQFLALLLASMFGYGTGQSRRWPSSQDWVAAPMCASKCCHPCHVIHMPYEPPDKHSSLFPCPATPEHGSMAVGWLRVLGDQQPWSTSTCFIAASIPCCTSRTPRQVRYTCLPLATVDCLLQCHRYWPCHVWCLPLLTSQAEVQEQGMNNFSMKMHQYWLQLGSMQLAHGSSRLPSVAASQHDVPAGGPGR